VEPDHEESELMLAKKAFSAAKVFDVLFLATEPSQDVLDSLIDDLAYFRFP